jgi:hypothetical protein
LTVVRKNEKVLSPGHLLPDDGDAFDGHARQQLVSLDQLGREAVEERLVLEQVQYVDIPLVLRRRRAGNIAARSVVERLLNDIDEVTICRIELDQPFSAGVGEQQLLFHLCYLVVQRRDLVGEPVETKEKQTVVRWKAKDVSQGSRRRLNRRHSDVTTELQDAGIINE